MKKFFYILLCSVSLSLSAQKEAVMNYQEIDERLIHFGFVLGVNTCDFDIRLGQLAADSNMFADISLLSPGFHVGIISNLRLNNYMDLRVLPGMSFGSRIVYYYKKVNGEYEADRYTKQRADFYPIEVPVILKLKADRIVNYRPYLIGGFTFRYDMSSSKKFNDEDLREGEVPRYIKFKPFDYYYSIGFGIDYYFEFFKLSTEIRMDFGQRDVLRHTPHARFPHYVDMIDQIRSNMVYLSFHFE